MFLLIGKNLKDSLTFLPWVNERKKIRESYLTIVNFCKNKLKSFR